jgi:hypothetical protein
LRVTSEHRTGEAPWVVEVNGTALSDQANAGTRPVERRRP